jgi:lysophospholipase L1-like esterase
MNSLRSVMKLVATQAFGVFIVLNVVIWGICLVLSLYNLVAESPQVAALRTRAHQAKLPNYAGVEWARTHFVELHAQSTRYVSYLGWRRRSFKGETINVEGIYGQRRTVGEAAQDKPSVYFFGGSTMWGTGADDANTIPSLVAQLGDFRSQNFGEGAYVAHQGLLLLIELLQDGHRPDVVVFYDGVNEVGQKCRSELTPKSHAREGRIKAALAATSADKTYDLRYMVGPLMAAAVALSDAVGLRRMDSAFYCSTDAHKAQQIADNLVQDWDVARRLVESYGGRFIGILQPVAYYSETKTDHIPLRDLQKRQYLAVYPLIKQRMAGRTGLYDFTRVLDHPEYLYIDASHLSPSGNRYVARKLVEVLRSKSEGLD